MVTLLFERTQRVKLLKTATSTRTAPNYQFINTIYV